MSCSICNKITCDEKRHPPREQEICISVKFCTKMELQRELLSRINKIDVVDIQDEQCVKLCDVVFEIGDLK